MLQRLITIKYSPIAIVFFLYSCRANESAPSPVIRQPQFKSLAVQQDGKDTGAWGYMVFKDDKPLIQQFTIPALEGKKLFSGREQAGLVGRLVAEKLNKATHPGITKKELDSLGIIPLRDATKEK